MTKKIKHRPGHEGVVRRRKAISIIHHTGEAAAVLSAGDFVAGMASVRVAFWVVAALLLLVTALSAGWAEE